MKQYLHVLNVLSSVFLPDFRILDIFCQINNHRILVFKNAPHIRVFSTYRTHHWERDQKVKENLKYLSSINIPVMTDIMFEMSDKALVHMYMYILKNKNNASLFEWLYHSVNFELLYAQSD